MSEAQPAARGAFIALLLGALGIAFAPILAKLAVIADGGSSHAERLSPVATAFWRMALAAPVFAGIWLVKRPRAGAMPLALGWRALLLPGLFFAMDLGTWHWSFEFTSVANSTLEANLAVVFVAAASWLWLKERFTWLFPVGAALAIGGMAALVGANFGKGGDAWIGDVMGLSVALFYTGYQLTIKTLVGKFPVLAVMTASTASCAVFLLLGVLVSPGRLAPATWQAWALVGALALVSQVFGQGLIAYGMKNLPVGLASVVLVAQPVMAALLGWALLGQALTWPQAGAGLFVVAGIYLARRGSVVEGR